MRCHASCIIYSVRYAPSRTVHVTPLKPHAQARIGDELEAVDASVDKPARAVFTGADALGSKFSSGRCAPPPCCLSWGLRPRFNEGISMVGHCSTRAMRSPTHRCKATPPRRYCTKQCWRWGTSSDGSGGSMPTAPTLAVLVTRAGGWREPCLRLVHASHPS